MTLFTGKYTLDPKADPIPEWAMTRSSQLAIPVPRKITANGVLRRCSRVILVNGDVARVHEFIIYNDSLGQLQLGRVEEIIADVTVGRILGLCLQTFLVGDPVLPYRFPALKPTGQHTWRKIQVSLPPQMLFNKDINLVLKECLAAVCAIHNCASHNCPVTNTREIIQERRKTGRFDSEVTHSPDLSDLVLNLAQLRSARYLQQFQPAHRYPNLPRAQLIATAVQHRNELQALQSASAVVVTPVTVSTGPTDVPQTLQSSAPASELPRPPSAITAALPNQLPAPVHVPATQSIPVVPATQSIPAVSAQAAQAAPQRKRKGTDTPGGPKAKRPQPSAGPRQGAAPLTIRIPPRAPTSDPSTGVPVASSSTSAVVVPATTSYYRSHTYYSSHNSIPPNEGSQ